VERAGGAGGGGSEPPPIYHGWSIKSGRPVLQMLKQREGGLNAQYVPTSRDTERQDYDLETHSVRGSVTHFPSYIVGAVVGLFAESTLAERTTAEVTGIGWGGSPSAAVRGHLYQTDSRQARRPVDSYKGVPG
jgi:hypothetical protein